MQFPAGQPFQRNNFLTIGKLCLTPPDILFVYAKCSHFSKAAISDCCKTANRNASEKSIGKTAILVFELHESSLDILLWPKISKLNHFLNLPFLSTSYSCLLFASLEEEDFF